MFDFAEIFGFRFTGYVLFIFVFSGLGLMISAPKLWDQGYTNEAKVAFWGGRIYIVGSITLYLIVRFFGTS